MAVKKPEGPQVESQFKLRPVQLLFKVSVLVEKDGKALDTLAAEGSIMEAGFNGTTISGLVERAVQAMQEKLESRKV